MNRYLPPSSETRATENREFEYQSIVYVYPASAVNAGANIFRRFRLTVAVSPQPSWPGLALLSGAVRCVLCLTQSLAACRRCLLSVVRCPRCPLSAVRCRLSDKHQQYTSEHLFPKVSENNLVSHFRQLHNVCTAQDIVLFWHTPHTVIRCTPYGKRLYDYLFDSSGSDVSPIYTILYMFYDAAAYNACCWCWCCFVATATDELWAQLSQLRYTIKTITHCIISATRNEKQKQKLDTEI